MTNPPGTLSIFCCGVLGALAPEIVRLYRLRRKLTRTHFPSGYWLISALYAGLGGVLAVILPATNLGAAFAEGVALPIAISALIHTRTRRDGASERLRTTATAGLIARFRTHAAGLLGR